MTSITVAEVKLSINQKLLGGVRSRSITQSTENANEVYDDNENGANPISTINNVGLRKSLLKQLAGTTEAIELGQVNDTSNQVIFELDYQENINPQVAANSTVKRIGINTATGVVQVANYQINHNKLHYLEVKIFEYVSNYLQSKNVVVVDIFARQDGQIKCDNTTPETHSIVLWKPRNDNDVILIDPSRVEFSRHIQEAVKNTPSLGINLIIHRVGKGIFYSTSRKLQHLPGYSNYVAESPHPRDCIDLAVKMALTLGQHTTRKEGLKAVSYLSNTKTYYGEGNKMPSIFDNTFMRELQSSTKESPPNHDDTRKGATDFIEAINVKSELNKLNAKLKAQGQNNDIVKDYSLRKLKDIIAM